MGASASDYALRMGFRFRRTIKVLPGIRLNLSKSGVSTSIGRRGAHVTIGHGKVRETVGLPGTGLSYTQVEDARRERDHGDASQAVPRAGGSLLRWLLGILLAFVLVPLIFAIVRNLWH